MVNTYIFEVTMCIGPSMMPTFSATGDIVLVERISVWRHRLQVGDVVVAQSPSNPAQTVCKRIRGLEGDVLRASKRHRYENGKIITVPKGHVWLEGDNQFNSSDSRHYGPVPYSIIKGRVFLRVWPLWDIGRVKNEKVR